MTEPFDHVAEIAAWLAASDVDVVLELTGPSGRLRLQRDGSGPVAADHACPTRASEPEGSPAAPEAVVSPGVGLFLHAHPMHAAPLVRPGERVTAGQVLGLLRIGALLIPVLAPRDGAVVSVAAPDASLVGFGDPLVGLVPLA